MRRLYGESLALLTDLYQISMAFGYWKSGLIDRQAIFHFHFRKHPFGGGYTIAAGLEQLIEYIQDFRFDTSDIEYLARQEGNDGNHLFDRAFLDYLANLRITVDIDAVPEGTAVFPFEPMIRVVGPILQCQLLETPLLNLINFPTLIATKAARVCEAAQGDSVLEFGLRRAQGIDGGVTSSRASYLGGCAGTSNVLAGKLFDIPIAGTHAHSWVMCFEEELEAFKVWAEAMPNNCVFLVDTYDTLEGVRRSVQVGEWLRERGHKFAGIRLDSGDLAWLSIQARKILDDAGFPEAKIVASNDLDERIIDSLKEQGATIAVWGVGTNLVTARDCPALGGVYKLSAIRDDAGKWEPRIKLSEQAIKITTPGMLQVRRFNRGDEFVADGIFDETHPPEGGFFIVDPLDHTRRKRLSPETPHEDLLVPIFRQGELVYKLPTLKESRQRVRDQLTRFHKGIRRFVNPHIYPVGLELGLHEKKTDLILKMRSNSKAEEANEEVNE